MIQLFRIIENQASLYSYRATENEERAVQLDQLIEKSKPKNRFPEWHPLIATPFRYDPPLKEGRFCPSYGKNVFYGSLIEETALYEHAFYFLRERIHLKKDLETETGIRTIFSVDTDDTNAVDISNESNSLAIMNKNDYSASYEYVTSNPKHTFILYPSCRDPQKRQNAAVLEIARLNYHPKWESAINFFYDNNIEKIIWLNYDLHIQWVEVK